MGDRIGSIFRNVRQVLEKWLLAWLVLLCLLAFYWRAWFTPAAVPDVFVAGKGSLSLLIAVTMLAIGSLLPPDEVRLVFRRWPTVFGGTAVQYAAMPLLAYAVGRACRLEGPWLIGTLMVGCVPGAMASNVLTLLSRGNVSYSVSLTTSATLLSPVMVPAVMYVTVGQVAEFPVLATAWQLIWMVVLPVVTGYCLARVWAAWRKGAERLGAIIANLTILWIIAVVVAVNRDSVTQVTAVLAAALLAINLGGYSAGFFGGRLLRLDGAMRRALTLEVGMQNAGLGTTLALALFPDQPQAAIPCALYTFGCMFTGTLLARIWSEFPPRETESPPAAQGGDGSR